MEDEEPFHLWLSEIMNFLPLLELKNHLLQAEL